MKLLSESAERQEETEKLQEIITSLTLQLREKNKYIEELKGNSYFHGHFHYMSMLLDLLFRRKACELPNDQGLETQMQPRQKQSIPSISKVTGTVNSITRHKVFYICCIYSCRVLASYPGIHKQYALFMQIY